MLKRKITCNKQLMPKNKVFIPMNYKSWNKKINYRNKEINCIIIKWVKNVNINRKWNKTFH